MNTEPTLIEIAVTPEQAVDNSFIEKAVRSKLQLKKDEQVNYKIVHRSIDARGRNIKVRLKVAVVNAGDPSPIPPFVPEYKNVKNSKEVLIIGAGPAGLFAALQLLELGIKPVIFERGKDVRERRRDIAELNKNHVVNAESNYCFGEGGAGTFSDGKLYTRSKKRGDVKRVLQVLVHHGAKEDILIDAHPHIGTNKLPGIITNMRETIESYGGEIHFNSKLTDIILDGDNLKGIEINGSDTFMGNQMILATGHSARDIFELLKNKGIEIERKPFSLGVRIEHPQLLIDQIQYHCSTRDPFLPPASYSLVDQSGKRGVYSFCMCPGGIIAPCATNTDEVVVNGWSPSKRDQASANSGIVVTVDIADFPSDSPLAGVDLQKEVEHKAWEMGGKTQTVPAQRLMDFLTNSVSQTLPETSYIPGIQSAPLSEVLPNFVTEALKDGFKHFGNKMKGYLTNEAVLHAPESRTSSPVRIPRDRDSLQHIRIKGLFPCGEGAGFAGGIVSAAIDGERCGRKCAL